MKPDSGIMLSQEAKYRKSRNKTPVSAPKIFTAQAGL
jgi:hypothetical protein